MRLLERKEGTKVVIIETERDLGETEMEERLRQRAGEANEKVGALDRGGKKGEVGQGQRKIHFLRTGKAKRAMDWLINVRLKFIKLRIAKQ